MEEQQLFTDAEYCIDKYFDDHLKSRLDELMTMRERVKAGEVATGFGITNALAPSEDYATNVTLSFPANDVDHLWRELNGNPGDIDVLAAAWRTAAVAKMGQERYDAISADLGNDLAKAYVGHRLTQRMIDYEAEKHPIKGSADYILGESHRSSIMSYLSPDSSEVQRLIDKKIIENYDPSLLEKGTGKLLGSLTDLAVTAPVSVPLFHVTSWATLTKFAVADVGVSLAGDAVQHAAFSRNDVGKMVSSVIFGNEEALSSCRKDYTSVNPYSSELIAATDEKLGKHIVRQSSSDTFGLGGGHGTQFVEQPALGSNFTDHFDMTMEHLNQQTAMHFAMREKFSDGGQQTTSKDGVTEDQSSSQQDKGAPLPSGSTKSVGGWGGMLDQLGLGGFGTVGKNLGYVLAMLPDLLIGMFTGKSRNLKIDDNLMPIVSIIAGMFVKNPLLKMLLIGLGGANLLNKAGHEALEHRDGNIQPVRQYRTYQDEPLDVRIKQPVLKGNTLVVNIDNNPLIITINTEAVDAYEKGVLPINTLANAVLRKYDEQQATVAENYEKEVSQDNVVERSRGLK
jgi:hypothetical protein